MKDGSGPNRPNPQQALVQSGIFCFAVSMNPPLSPKLLLDFGQVLTLEQNRRVFDPVLQAWHCSPEAFFPRWAALRPDYDLGVFDPLLYWSKVKAAVFNEGKPDHEPSAISAGELAELVKTDLQAFANPRAAMHTVVRRCMAAGVPVGILSNMPPGHGELWDRTWPWLQGCAVRLWSGDEGIAKPDPAFYGLFLQRSAWAAADILFVDDVLENVEAARQLGMTGHHFADEAQAIQQIRHWCSRVLETAVP